MAASRFQIAVLIVLFLVGPAVGQEKQAKGWLIDVPKGTVVTLKIPLSAVHDSPLASRIPAEHPRSIIEQSDSSLVVDGQPDWETAAFPSMLRLTLVYTKRTDDVEGLLESIGQARHGEKGEKKTAAAKVTEVGLLAEGGKAILLHFRSTVTDVSAAFRKIVIIGEPAGPEAVKYLHDVRSDRSARFFAGTLSKIDDERKLALLSVAEAFGDKTTMGSEAYKDKSFFVVNLGADGSVYNTNRMNQSDRVSKVINDKLLAVLKVVLKTLPETPGLYGVKVEVKILYRNFMDDSARVENDTLSIYAPLSSLRKFLDADITGQQLMDESVELVNENRVKVTL